MSLIVGFAKVKFIKPLPVLLSINVPHMTTKSIGIQNVIFASKDSLGVGWNDRTHHITMDMLHLSKS